MALTRFFLKLTLFPMYAALVSAVIYFPVAELLAYFTRETPNILGWRQEGQGRRLFQYAGEKAASYISSSETGGQV